jgi:surfactin synthase thioesterase subunit
MKSVNIFCFPFAGGSKYSYSSFQSYLPSTINLIPVDLPGRGTRMDEPLLNDVNLLCDDVYKQIKPRLGHPYAFYGHSMGSLMAYLITRRVIRDGLNPPVHLFFTGCVGPSKIASQMKTYDLPKDQFLSELKKMGGSPAEVLDDAEFMELYEPILRADFEAAETYQHIDVDPFHIPIWVAIGKDEPANPDTAGAWKNETTADVKVFEFPGDHFFILEQQQKVTNLMLIGLQKVAL